MNDMFNFELFLVFLACFLCAFVVSAVCFYRKMHRKKKYAFKAGVYDGKDIEVDHKISQYLKDDMEHHSSKAFKSIEDPDDR